MRILVFLHGTSIMHKNAKGLSREEIMKRVKEGDESVHDYFSYFPIGDVVKKLKIWEKQGAEICYLSSHENEEDVEKDKFVLRKYGFPIGQIFYRQNGEQYKNVIERVNPLPDVIIEDDCESIGGEIEMTYPHLEPELKAKIKSIVVKEFEGINPLPDKISELMKYN